VPRRSCLTVPASNVRMLEKAATLPADEIVVDLEDGTPAADKDAARENLATARARGLLAVRINGFGSAWFEQDLQAVAHLRPDAVVLPKAELAHVASVRAALPAGVALEVLIETARALVEVEQIAAAGVDAIVFGPGDFAASLGVPVLTIGAGASEYALARIAVAARAFGVQPIDGPYAVLDDDAGLRAAAERALELGYDGKWCIHPRQLEIVNDVFTASAAEVERARRIAAAADGASAVDGEMVDAATKRLAEGVIARAAPPSEP
jgi:citrate lyase subunit beta/citryl-CoA lyase